jgi:LysM repeat protein
MSKDVVFAAVIVVACLGLITLAFVVPRHKAPDKELATTSETASEGETAPTAPTMPTTGTTDPFALPSDPLSTPGSSSLANNNAFSPLSPSTGGTQNFTPMNDFPPMAGSNTGSSGLNNSSSFNNFPTNTPPPISAPITAPTDSAATTERSHTVAAGETLGEISHKYYQTAKHWKKIAEANKVDPSDLKVGQKLIIPVVEGASSTSSTASASSVALAAGERSYTVQKGDSYYRIAEKELGSAARWKEIEKLNNIPASDLVVGKAIKLPAKDNAGSSLSSSEATGSVSGSSASGTSDGTVHVVAAGETLSDISKKYFGTTKKWKDIVNANPGVDPEGLRVGQKLKLPEGANTSGSPAPSSTSSSASSSSLSGANYTVKAGDTPASIAAKELGSSKEWAKIMEANPGLDPRKLRIGQQIVIPGKSTPSAPTSNNSNANGFGFGTPSTPSTPSNNSGFGSFPSAPATPNNNFAPSGLPPAPSLPSGSTGSSNSFTPGNTYPTPGSATPPAPSNGLPSSPLPDSFGNSSGFGNQP